MEKIMTYETLRSFTYSNDHLIEGPIRGIVISFFGLSAITMYSHDSGDALDYAREGIVYLVPYYNPWAWMNKQAVEYTDEIIDVLREKYSLGNDIKIVSSGGSMGGLSALVYSAYAKLTPIACVTNCPVCDLPYHFTERPDLPRTLYSAFWNYDGTMEEAMRTASPLHLADKMPKIPYTVFHCEKDTAVSLEHHSIPFVRAMEDNSHNITLKVIPLRNHCELTPEALLDYNNTILDAFR